MTPGPRVSRPAGAPAYYLGRPASVWMTTARHRRRAPVVDREEERQQTRSRKPSA
jgi:hypothetical protein